jgi:hypothetical protein
MDKVHKPSDSNQLSMCNSSLIQIILTAAWVHYQAYVLMYYNHINDSYVQRNLFETMRVYFKHFSIN